MKLFGAMEIESNELCIGGISCSDLVKEFGSPLYVMDENLLISTCKSYYDNFKCKENHNRVAYAGKAFLTKAMCKLVNEQGLYLDVVSGGELFTAYKAGFPLNKVYFHGNNKSRGEIELGVKLGVGRFVVDNLDEILQVSDGLMVARGDLGVEIPTEDIPIVQKQMIKKCNALGKPVITATQMLDSMIRNPRPTRAEVTDVANAIYDGTDAIMLSGESASGQYPIEAANTMSKIAKETELHLDYNYLNQRLKEPAMYDFAEAISYSTCRTSNVLNAKAIVAATNSGATAKLVSKYKPKCPIIAITPHEEVMRGLSLNFGVYPVLCQEFATTDDILNESKKIVAELNLADKGDDIIVAAGMPTNYTGGTNMLKIEKL